MYSCYFCIFADLSYIIKCFISDFQMQISESSHPLWVEFTPTLGQNEGDQSSVILIKSGLASYDGE